MIKELRDYFIKCDFLDQGAQLGIDYLGANRVSYSINIEPTTPILKSYVDGGAIKALNFNFVSREYYSPSSPENIDNLEFYKSLEAWIKSNNKNGALPLIKGAIQIDVLSNGYLMDSTSDDGQYMIQLRLVYEED